jgi:serine/threonine-protein kinase
LTITTASSSFRGASWGDNDLVVFTPSTSDPLYSVSAAGGEPVQVTTIDSATGEVSHRWPVLLPGSKAVVFTIFDGSAGAEAELAVVSLETGVITRLRLKGMHPQYAPSGHLVYGTTDAALIAVPFDKDRLEITGPPVSLLEGLMTRISVTAEFSISPSGELAYLTGLPPEFSLVLVDPDGAELKIIEDVQDLRGPRFSTDGNRIAMELSEGGMENVWVYDLREETLTRMTFDGANYPEWTPDDKYVSFSSTGSDGSNRDIYRTASDGSGVPELVYGAPEIQWEGVWMPDGQSMVVREIGTGTSGDIILVGIDPPEDPQPLVNTDFDERSPKPSPDGRWLAYRSDESGRNEVFVRPIPGPGGKRQVSDGGGTEPLWSPDGSKIFYRGADGNFYSVAMRTSPTLSVGRRTILFEDNFVPNSAHANYDQHPTTGQFVMVKGTATKSDLVIVLNWSEELKARME